MPKGVPARELLVYLCAFISLTSGVGLLVKRVAPLAARVLLAYLLFVYRGFMAATRRASSGATPAPNSSSSRRSKTSRS